MGMKKTCSGCRESKDVELFSKNSSARDGRCYYCRSCARKAEKKHRDKVTSKLIESQKRLKKPHKIRATRLVQQLLISGKIKKSSCFFCGKNETIEGHHIFYDEPKKVLWLCRAHHHKFHRLWKEQPEVNT